VQVTVTSDGRLQLSEDGLIYQPLSVAEVEALANAIPAAQSVVNDVSFATAIRDATESIIYTAAGTYAAMTVQDSYITLLVDPAIFAALYERAFSSSVDPSLTSYIFGPMTVTMTGA
jgi:hypothetical protein